MRTVFVNGVFDILHVGHIDLIECAQAMGDKLVIGINSDESASSLKPGRPINSQKNRKRMLLKLNGVNHVVIFNGLNCAQLIYDLKPDVWVKGPDYTLDTINSLERQAIDDCGGMIVISPRFNDISTSSILKKL